MKAIPSRARIVLVVLGALLSVVLILGGYGYYQMTAEVDAAGLEAPNNLDAKELDRKLKLLDTAVKSSRRGFVRLSEVEINSYLHEHYPGKTAEGSGAAPVSGCRLLKSRVDLTTTGAILYTWLQLRWHNHTWDLCVQRTAQVRYSGDHWTFALTSLRIGRQRIPPQCWGKVHELLQAGDESFLAQYRWLTQLPSLEIRLSEVGLAPELRLYTFREPALWRQAQR